MILVVDVGNTNITCGVYKEKELLTTFRITTKSKRTSDEYGIMLTGMLTMNQIKAEDITGAIIASVVPNVMHALNGALVRYLHVTPLIVGPGTKTGIRITNDNQRRSARTVSSMSWALMKSTAALFSFSISVLRPPMIS